MKDDVSDNGIDPDDGVIATLRASPLRRMAGATVVGCLGLFLLWLGVVHPPQDAIWQFALLLGGVLALYGALQLWHATARMLVLTQDALRDTDGRMVASMPEVRSVARGTFAFKPSNGFVLVLSRNAGTVWAPGLWWRIGRHVGVGGVTPADQGRFMAERIAELTLRVRDKEASSRKPSE